MTAVPIRTDAAPAAVPAAHRPGRTRTRGRVAGGLYLLTFATSVPTLALYAPVVREPRFVLGVGHVDGVLAGACLEVLLAIACAGTAVVLLPVLRRHAESAAFGFLASRLTEAALILLGVACLLTVVSLRRDATAADPAALVTTARALVAAHAEAFLLGQSLMPVLNAAFLGSLLYRARLVPRVIPLLGLVGAPVLLASDVAILWGAYDAGSATAALGALPIAGWELLLGLWLVARGLPEDEDRSG